MSKERWELLLIDNASETRLESIHDISWHPNSRQIQEGTLGVAWARRRGMREALADLLVFVDDDNVLGQGYLSEVIKIKQEWGRLGVWGSGTIVPEFELQPPAHLRCLLPYLAIRELEAPLWTNVASNDIGISKAGMPWGAGLCVRANVAAAYCRLPNRSGINISGRQGASLLSGEDVEICLVSCKLGFGMGIFPELELTHLIPEGRVAENYLLNLVEGTTFTDSLLAYKWLGMRPHDAFSVLGLLGVAKNALIRRGVEKRAYLAHWRARAKATRIIAGMQSGDSK